MASPDTGSAATTLTTTTNKVVQDTGLAGTLKQAGDTVSKIKNAVTSGLGINISSITSAIPGASEIQSAIQQARNNIVNLGNLAQNAIAAITKVASGISGPVPNILHSYASVNYIFTLSGLNDDQVNFPDETYRRGQLGTLILKSGSGNPSNRVPTVHRTSANPAGTYDFYIENFSIDSVIGFEETTGNTNATGFNLKIIEPYSMGMFFEVLQASAFAAGFENYLEMPLLLTIEFKGHIDADLQNVQIDRTTKYFPLKLSTMNMKVSGKGSEYEIAGYPFNEKAYSTIYSELKTDVSISGKTIVDMLQTGERSLQVVLNQRLEEAVKRKDAKVADQILISFPKDLKTGNISSSPSDDDSAPVGATADPKTAAAGSGILSKLKVKTASGKINKTQIQEEGTVNDLGISSMGFDLYNNGATPFAKDDFAYDTKTHTYTRGNVSINPNEGVFKFAQGSDVVNAINQVILMSEYGRTALKQISSTGTVQWWRIETQMYFLSSSENIAKTGVKPKLIVFRVVPYSVDASVFLPPNTPKPGTEQAKQEVVKEYNCMYTGKNVDVINWDIEFNAGFYASMAADGGKNTGDSKITEQASGASSEDPQADAAPPEGGAAVQGQNPTSVIRDKTKTKSDNKGGGGLEDAASRAAKQFHDAITAGVDMINLNLSILGDPYYLADSGMGNYSAVATDNPHITADGSMNYQNGEVLVTVNFRTPLDANTSTGLYDFRDGKVGQFSGLYKVLTVKSNFAKGKFTQELSMVRLPGQEVASTSTPTLVVQPGELRTPGDTQTFDDGSNIQTFDDGSTLVTDSEGGVSSTPAL